VAAAAVAPLIVSAVEPAPLLPAFALLTKPAQPLSPVEAKLKQASASRPRNLLFAFVVERIVVNIIAFPRNGRQVPNVLPRAFPTQHQATEGINPL
jgi:hypothetical protein